MKYLETKHERNSAKITTLMVLILILLCFVVGQTYQDPPEEYGVAVNFGNSAIGSGNVQPDKSVKSKDLNRNKQPQETQPESTKAEEQEIEETQTVSKEVKEEVLTQDSEEAIAIKKAEAAKKVKVVAEAKAKAEADRIAAVAEKKRQEEVKKKAELDAMMGGMNNANGDASGSEGNDNQAGDKGQLNGNPYAPSYFGNSGTGNGGVGSGLNGRGRGRFTEIKQKCNESGLVVVRIEVDKNGKVVKAEAGVKGTENTAPCLLEPAKQIALSGKWPADAKAPTRQIGFVSIDFKLGQ